MKYTTQEIRGAILRAADRIEANPKCFDYGISRVDGIDRYGAGCVLSHIGYALGMEKHTLAVEVADAIGIRMSGPCDMDSHMFKFLTEKFGDSETWPTRPEVGWTQFPLKAAAGMRAYANKYFPEARPVVAEDRQLVPWSQCVFIPKALQGERA